MLAGVWRARDGGMFWSMRIMEHAHYGACALWVASRVERGQLPVSAQIRCEPGVFLPELEGQTDTQQSALSCRTGSNGPSLHYLQETLPYRDPSYPGTIDTVQVHFTVGTPSHALFP